MPRPLSRALLPFFRVLKDIAADDGQPVPIRLRCCELCIALRSGEWGFATGSKTLTRAIRKVTAADSIDEELLRLSGLMDELKRETSRIATAIETPDQRQEREINQLLERARAEKEENSETDDD